MGKRKEIKYRKKKKWIWLNSILTVGFFLIGCCYFLQRYTAHQEGYFVPEYARVTLTEESDELTIFLQTGLGRPAVDRLLGEGDFTAIQEAQERFFQSPEATCLPLLGWFTREDRLQNEMLPEFVDLQPGDILLTLSTHSLGWRHGHAALVINEDTTLESAVLGTDSVYGSTENWRSYANFAVLRVKNITSESQQQVVAYGKEALYGVPYRLSAGFVGDKAAEQSKPYFGVHCSYLVWYAWNYFGYDLDSDGGRLVTSYDLLHSELLEVVQIYGMDPGEFGG